MSRDEIAMGYDIDKHRYILADALLPPVEQRLAFHGFAWMTFVVSDEPTYRDCVEDSKNKRSIDLRTMVGESTDDAVALQSPSDREPLQDLESSAVS